VVLFLTADFTDNTDMALIDDAFRFQFGVCKFIPFNLSAFAGAYDLVRRNAVNLFGPRPHELDAASGTGNRSRDFSIGTAARESGTFFGVMFLREPATFGPRSVPDPAPEKVRRALHYRAPAGFARRNGYCP
jgi:hypothetical protein